MTKEAECVPKKGDWVLLKDDKIIACDENIAKIMKIADEYRSSNVVIAKEPSSTHCYY